MNIQLVNSLLNTTKFQNYSAKKVLEKGCENDECLALKQKCHNEIVWRWVEIGGGMSATDETVQVGGSVREGDPTNPTGLCSKDPWGYVLGLKLFSKSRPHFIDISWDIQTVV